MNDHLHNESDEFLFHPRYRILKKLGSGGMGHVFKAADLLNGITVVIKALPEHNDDDIKKRLITEFLWLHDIRHPSVPEVYDLFVENGFPAFYTMEWIDGISLREVIVSKADIPEQAFYSIFFQLLQFLDYMSKKNIVHRDLKPENLIIRGLTNIGHDPRPEIKIIDFGLAGKIQEIRNEEFSGTIQYAAPETIKKTQCDHRSDLYSLGVIMYEWLSGINPFDAPDIVNVVINHLEKKVDPPSSRFSFTSEIVTAVVLKCLNKNPEHRYQNTGEIFRDVLKNSISLDHWKKYQRDRAFFLNTSFFISNDGFSRLYQNVENVFHLKHYASTWISVKGDSTSGKSAILNEIKIKSAPLNLSIIMVPAKQSTNPIYNIESLFRQIEFLISDSDDKHHLKSTLNYLNSINPDDDDSEQTIVDALWGSIHPEARLLVLIDSEHNLSDQEKNILKKLYQKIHTHPVAQILVIHTSPRGYRSMLTEALPYEEIEIPLITTERLADYCGHLLFYMPFDDTFVEFLARRSTGNPFLLKETVKHCLQSHFLEFDGFTYHFIPPSVESLPDSVQSFLIRQLDFLPEPGKKILTRMSLFDGFLSMKEIIDTVDVEHHEVQLDLLVRLDIITKHYDTFQIKNSYLRKHLYDTIDIQRRKILHKALSEYYLSQDNGLFVLQLAAHLYGAEAYQSALPFIIKAGERLTQEKKFRAALEQFETAYSIVKNEKPPEQKSRILSDIINLCDLTAERNKQAEFLSYLDNVTKDSAIQELRVDYLMLFGNYLERISSYDQSEKVIREAIRISDSLQHKNHLYALYRMLGRSYYQRSRWQDALVCYQHALSEIQESTDLKAESELLNSIGAVYGTLRKWELAMNTFGRVLELASGAGDDKSRLNALINLGFIAHQKRDEQTALEYYYQAEKLISISRNKKYEQRLKQYMGISFRMVKLYEQALAYFEDAQRLSHSLDDPQSLGKAYSEQAIIYHRLGWFSEAIDFMSKAIIIAEEIDNPKDTAARRLRKAEMLLDSDKSDEARTLVNQAKPYMDAHGDDEWRVYAGWLNLKLLLQSDVKINSDFFESEFSDRCAQLLTTAEKNKFDSLRVLFYDLMAEQSVLNHNLTAALDYSAKATELIGKTDYIEFDECPVLFRRFQIMSEDPNVLRQERGRMLEWAYQAITATEKSLNRSDLKEHYHFKPIVKTIRENYRMFFNEELQFQQESFKVLFEIAKSINSILEPERLFETIMDETIRHSGADRGLILFRDENDDSFDIKTARHIDPNDLKDVEQISLSIVRDVYESGQPVVTADAQTDERFRERQSVMAYHIRSIMCVPLKIRERIVGAVYVDKQFDSNYFNESNVRFLESFAHLSAIAIENARLYSNLKNEKDDLQKENIDLRHLVQEKYVTHNIVGRSKPMADVFRMIDMAATSGAPVIIEGESGTGKELAAKAIHFNSPRKDKPFITVDCGSLTESLLESELFGYKKGAFTGAVTDKKGLFEEADAGTLFLDEITNTSLNFQSKLLRVLQEGEIRRVGDSRTRRLDVRIITATNRNLNQEVQQNRFREDLYYRLNVLKIYLPPLRDRREDIPLLIHFFMQKYNKTHNKNVETLTQDLLAALTSHSWPGNIREMDNLVNRMILFSTEKTLHYSELPEELKSVIPEPAVSVRKFSAMPAGSKEQFDSLEDMEDHLNTIEKNFFNQVLSRADGNKSKAAEILGIKRTTLNDRLKKLGLL